MHWKGYDSSEDTWEPIEGLRFVQSVYSDGKVAGLDGVLYLLFLVTYSYIYLSQ